MLGLTGETGRLPRTTAAKSMCFATTSWIILIFSLMDAKPLIDLRERVFDFHGNGHEEITFRQLPLQQFSAMDVSLPIDKIVATLITK